MKSIYKYLTGSISLITTLLVVISCSSEYEYKTDYSSYKDVKLNVELVDDNNVLNVKRANGTHVLTIGVTPADVFIDSKAYIYEISDKTIATAEKDGTLNLLKVGETTITVKFRGNQEIFTTCTLKVAPTLVTELKVSTRTISVEEGKTLDLTEYINAIPLSADNTALNFVVKEGYEEIAEITEGSTVLGKQKETAIIVATTTDGSNLSAEMTVNVTGKIPVSEIKLNAADRLQGKSLAVGQTFNIGSSVTVQPSNASNKELVYSIVSGNGVVSMDDKGVLKTLTAGDAKIKIATTDNSGVQVELSLKVDPTITSFERALWNVTTSGNYANGMNYIADGSTGKPEDLLDGNTKTYLSLRKPEYFNYKEKEFAALNKEIFFIVDMGGGHEFNNVIYQHRSLNDLLAAKKITISGSNDGTNFNIIEDFETPYQTAPFSFNLSTKAKYRYIKVQPTLWALTTGSSGTSIQIAEFNVANK